MVGLGLLLGGLAFWLLPRTYEAQATILAPKEAAGGGEGLTLLLQAGRAGSPFLGGVLPSLTRNRDVLVSVLKSRTLARAAVERFGLATQYRARSLEAAVTRFQRATRVSVSREGTIAVAVEAADPRLAADLANFAVDHLDELLTRFATDEAGRDRTFLDARLAQVGQALRAAEDALKRFQEQHGAVVLPEQSKAAIEAQARLKGELLASEVQLEVLRSFAADDHPNVIQVKRRIGELKRQLGQLRDGSGPARDLPFAKVPEVALELARLTREVKVQETVYTLLAQQREQAKVAEARDLPAVQVLDRAVPPEEPTSPRLGVTLTLGAFTGLILGIPLVFGVERRAGKKPKPRRSRRRRPMRRRQSSLLQWLVVDLLSRRRRPMGRRQPSRLSGILGGLLPAVLLLVPLEEGRAADRTNVPLQNWGGFAVTHHWTYDAIEKLALAGLLDRAVLTTRPMSRLELARLIARAIHAIDSDRRGRYHDRVELEGVLEALLEAFQPELAELGVPQALRLGKPPGRVAVKPVEQVQLRGLFADRDLLLENRQGEAVPQGFGLHLAARSRAQVGDWLSVAVSPEVSLDDAALRARLIEGAVKLTWKAVELEVGRDSLWWGPGFHGALLFSTNARPLDLIKLSSAESFRLPGLFRSVGPTKLTFFLAQLEEDRDFPHAKLAGLRVNTAPFPWLEVGASRAIQFGGEGRPSPRVEDIPGQFLGEEGGGPRGPEDRRDNNQLWSADVTVRLPHVDRVLPLAPTKDVAVYAEVGSDDKFRLSRAGLIVGLVLPDLLGSAGTDLRLEYATLHRTWYRHGIYTSGFTLDGRILGHHVGGDGRDVYVRLTRPVTPDLQVGVELDWERRGNAGLIVPPTRVVETRWWAGLDVSVRLSKALTLFGAYRLEGVTNRDFQVGRDGVDHLVELRLTAGF